MARILKEWLEWKLGDRVPAKIEIPIEHDGLSAKDLTDLEAVFKEVRTLLVLKVKRKREYDWRVLMAVLNHPLSGTGVRARRP